MGNSGRRENLAGLVAECWRPPIFGYGRSRWQRVSDALRRFFDLQAASVWRDLANELPKVRGALLDVGCGAQPYRRLLAADVSYVGIDSIAANAHFGYTTPDTRYFACPLGPCDAESVDVARCPDALGHVVEPCP